MCCGFHPSTPRDFSLHPQQVTSSLELFFLVSSTLFIHDPTIQLRNRTLLSYVFFRFTLFLRAKIFKLRHLRSRNVFDSRHSVKTDCEFTQYQVVFPVPSDQGVNLLTQFYLIPRVRMRGSLGLCTRP